MYAVIATGGNQYKVSEGDIITVEKLGLNEGESVTFDQVIAVNDGSMKVAGDVANATVTGSRGNNQTISLAKSYCRGSFG